STGATSVVRNFGGAPTSCPSGNWAILLSLGSDPQYMGFGPEKILGLQCGSTKFTYSITYDAVLGVKVLASPNAPVIAPSGAVALLADWIYDYALNPWYRLPVVDPYNHSSLGRSLAGHDTLSTVAFDDPPDQIVTLVS